MAPSLDSRLLAVVTISVVGLLIGSVPAATTNADFQQIQPETDNTVTRIDVSESGDARWTIQIRTRLATDEHVTEYRAFQSRFRNDTGRYLGPFSDRIRGIVADAANATGRKMRATNFTASTRIQEMPRRWGIVTYEFTWRNFAARSDESLVVGDVFQGGFFIAANDTLQIDAPEGYEISGVEPPADDRERQTVSWTGREDFPDRNPMVVFSPVPAGGPTTVGPDGRTQSTPASSDGAQSGGLVLGAAIVILAIVGVGAFAVYRHRGAFGSGVDAAAPAGDQPQSAPVTENEAQQPVRTDEERVLDCIAAHGGRVKQAAIAEEFDWSASKTSRVISSMADDGAVEKIQLGRENLVTLPEDGE